MLFVCAACIFGNLIWSRRAHTHTPWWMFALGRYVCFLMCACLQPLKTQATVCLCRWLAYGYNLCDVNFCGKKYIKRAAWYNYGSVWDWSSFSGPRAAIIFIKRRTHHIIKPFKNYTPLFRRLQLNTRLLRYWLSKKRLARIKMAPWIWGSWVTKVIVPHLKIYIYKYGSDGGW